MSADDETTIARLLGSFEAYSRQEWSDEADADPSVYADATFGVLDIAQQLEAMRPSQRAVLATLLDSADARIRVNAALYIRDILPERAYPVLKEVMDSQKGPGPNIAALQAFWTYPDGPPFELSIVPAAELLQQWKARPDQQPKPRRSSRKIAMPALGPGSGPALAALARVTDRQRQELGQASVNLGQRGLASDDPLDDDIMSEFDRVGEMAAKLAANGMAALNFCSKAPYPLSSLRSDKDKAPTSGFCDHAIVAAEGNNLTAFSDEVLRSPDNLIRIPIMMHDAVGDEYVKSSEVFDKTIGQWLQTQPYDVQYKYGINVLRDLGIIP